MARAHRTMCDSCESPRVALGAPFCGACGHPTPWATHEERTDWEVRQWRKVRGEPQSGVASVVPLPSARDRRPRPERDDWDDFVPPAAPKPRPVRERRPGGLTAMIKRAMAALRKIFRASMMVPLDRETAPAPEPVPAPVPDAPPRMLVVRTPEEAPAPAPARRPPAKPRQRPAAPTNKDMLKQTLSMLTKVEQRLEQLEQEVAGIDSAVRGKAPAGDEQPAVGR